jgi:hypothetical protein
MRAHAHTLSLLLTHSLMDDVATDGSVNACVMQDGKSEADVLEMLGQLRETFARMLKRADWMSQEARKTAVKKLMVCLAQMHVFISRMQASLYRYMAPNMFYAGMKVRLLTS